MHYRTMLLEFFALAANLSCFCHPVCFVHQHLPCDVLWTKRNLKPKQMQHEYIPQGNVIRESHGFYLGYRFLG